VLATVAHQHDASIGERLAAVGAALERLVITRRFLDGTRLPVRPLDRPGHDVLEAAERCAPLAGGLGEPVAAVALDAFSTPGAALLGFSWLAC